MNGIQVAKMKLEFAIDDNTFAISMDVLRGKIYRKIIPFSIIGGPS
jgi:hypothetical protein